MANEIKAIIFDVGGVLYKESMNNVYSKLSKVFNLDLERFYKVRQRYIMPAQLGKLSALGYLKLIAKDLEIKNINEFLKTWENFREKELKLQKDVEKTVLKLKKSYIIGTLTNVTKINDKIRIRKNCYKHFKIRLISNKIGLRKPDIRFYKLLIKKLKILPQEIIFVDDERKQILPARKLGMKTILFKNNKQLKANLQRLGIKI